MSMTPTQLSLRLLRENGYTAQVIDRLEHHLEADESGCWRWIGARDKNGYGRCSQKTAGLGEKWAHRLMFRLLVGPIPPGMELDHLCRNHGCVNPHHLEAVTHAENMRRSPLVGRAQSAKTHCVNGHERTPDNLYHAPKTGHSACLICKRATYLRWKARR